MSSIPHVVIVRVDFAPWDSDIEFEARVLEFADRATAFEFHEKAVKLAHEYDPDIIVQVLEPEPVIVLGDNPTLALAMLVDWLAEADPV